MSTRCPSSPSSSPVSRSSWTTPHPFRHLAQRGRPLGRRASPAVRARGSAIRARVARPRARRLSQRRPAGVVPRQPGPARWERAARGARAVAPSSIRSRWSGSGRSTRSGFCGTRPSRTSLKHRSGAGSTSSPISGSTAAVPGPGAPLMRSPGHGVTWTDGTRSRSGSRARSRPPSGGAERRRTRSPRARAAASGGTRAASDAGTAATPPRATHRRRDRRRRPRLRTRRR